MNNYLIFIVNKEYEQGSLEDHIDYIRNQGGSADCWSSADTIRESIIEADQYQGETVIYDYYGECFID